jgi:gamma-glutamyltranspeptidase/glutathione hydrolase
MGHLSADYIHTVVEAMKLALADRDAYYADPRFADVPLEGLLSKEYADLRRALIDPERASTSVRPGDPRNMRPSCDVASDPDWIGGTTTCVVSDRFGNVVSVTPSANPPYHLCEELGVAHGNRLRCFNTIPGHPNHIESGKRPRITLTPTLVVKADGSVLAISVSGGDLQDQTTLNCLLNHLDFGMTPAKSVTAPRFSTGHHQNSFRPDAARGDLVSSGLLNLNAGISEEAASRLRAKGHRVHRAKRALARPVMLHLNPKTGVSQAAGDPEAGRYAQAID